MLVIYVINTLVFKHSTPSLSFTTNNLIWHMSIEQCDFFITYSMLLVSGFSHNAPQQTKTLFFLKKKLHCIFKDPICLRENFCSNREYLVSKQVLHSDIKKHIKYSKRRKNSWKFVYILPKQCWFLFNLTDLFWQKKVVISRNKIEIGNLLWRPLRNSKLFIEAKK